MKRLLVLTTAVLYCRSRRRRWRATYESCACRRRRLRATAPGPPDVVERLRHRLLGCPGEGIVTRMQRRLRVRPEPRERLPPVHRPAGHPHRRASPRQLPLQLPERLVRRVRRRLRPLGLVRRQLHQLRQLLRTRHRRSNTLLDPRAGHCFDVQRLPALRPGRHPRDEGRHGDDRRPDAAECRDHGRVGDAAGVAERGSGRVSSRRRMRPAIQSVESVDRRHGTLRDPDQALRLGRPRPCDDIAGQL